MIRCFGRTGSTGLRCDTPLPPFFVSVDSKGGDYITQSVSFGKIKPKNTGQKLRVRTCRKKPSAANSGCRQASTARLKSCPPESQESSLPTLKQIPRFARDDKSRAERPNRDRGAQDGGVKPPLQRQPENPHATAACGAPGAGGTGLKAGTTRPRKRTDLKVGHYKMGARRPPQKAFATKARNRVRRRMAARAIGRMGGKC
jgi:hypothetical protein